MENIKPKIMILGTFHMRYTPDLYRVEADDLLSDKRQKEIKEVVEKVKRFRPTKIAFEVVKEEEGELNREYQLYVNGEMEAKMDEVHQYGFRLASDLEHENVYAVDWMESVGNRGIGQVFQWAEKEQPELFKYINEEYRTSQENDYKNSTIGELMRNINKRDSTRKDHEKYMAVARIGSSHDYVGIDWLRWWYQRNLIIYANLAELAVSSTDRILLIIGSAHVHLISQFLNESGMFEVVTAEDYL
ncbi:DUF5694 domain-containing protein [Rossellomorea vietnamensis]|nr:DUF5694 domain-containing protein [Rossellomorea vietnamensis]